MGSRSVQHRGDEPPAPLVVTEMVGHQPRGFVGVYVAPPPRRQMADELVESGVLADEPP